MSYIFSIHKTGIENLEDWQETQLLDHKLASTINDESLELKLDKIGTSIPTPMARLLLFDTAFKIVDQNRDLPKKNVYYNLVSECLDLFQLVFQLGNDPELSFKNWNINDRITELKSKSKVLAETMNYFLSVGPFKGMSQFTLIYYKGKLIGGTSPYTIFATSPNQKLKAHTIKTPKGHLLFGDDPQMLNERDERFQKFMYHFYDLYKAQFLAAESTLKGLGNYLSSSRSEFGVNNLNPNYDLGNYQADYPKIETGRGQSLTIRDIEIRSKGSFDPVGSDFTIHSKINPSEKKPLVLAEGKHFLNYLGSQWDPQITIDPTMKNVALDDRYLPGVSKIKYPFLFVDDFLAEKIIALPYEINQERYFNPTASGFGNILLPINPLYFHYFTLDDLRNQLSVEYLQNSHALRYQLDIPLLNDKQISLIKDYDLEYNCINTEKAFFSLAVFPFYKLARPEINKYTINLIRGDEALMASLKFYTSGQYPLQELEYHHKIRSVCDKKETFYQSEYYFINGQSFDFVQLDVQDEEGQSYNALICPLFAEKISNSGPQFFVGIDFGTSNTYMAYCSSTNKQIRTFDIGSIDQQLVPLNRTDDYGAFNYPVPAMNREFIPLQIGEGKDTSYPIRTATCENPDFSNTNDLNALFGQINVAFSIDKEQQTALDNQRFDTEIKWGLSQDITDRVYENRVLAFFTEHLWLVKNKIIENNGNLSNSKISWFTPSSMPKKLSNKLNSLWLKAGENVWGGGFEMETNFIHESESIAPFYALVNKQNVLTGANTLNIDIGGGTTDVLYFINHPSKRTYSTSFRFAGNDIWGDGLSSSPQQNNGFLSLDTNVDENGRVLDIPYADTDVNRYFKVFIANPSFDSADACSFLFRYVDAFQDKIVNHEKLRIIPVIHLGAILYHLSDIIKTYGLGIPSNISFTGKGSEYLKIISHDAESLEELIKTIFEVFLDNTKLPHNFRVVVPQKPKQLTAEGGVMKLAKKQDLSMPKPESLIHPGLKDFDQEKVYRMQDVSSNLSDVKENLVRFLSILFTDERIKEKLSDNDLKISQKRLGFRIDEFLNDLLDESFQQMQSLISRELDEEDRLEESMFFWGLKHALYQLSKKLVKP